MADDILQVLASQTAILLAFLLLASALHKTLNWSRAREAALQLVGRPARRRPARPKPVRRMLARLAACALAAVVAGETAAAGLLLVAQHRVAGAALAAGIWMLYLSLLVRAFLQGRREVDCGCSIGIAAHPLGAYHLVRNGVLTALAGFTLWATLRGDAVAAAASQLIGGIALLALYAALDQVMSLRPLRRGEVL